MDLNDKLEEIELAESRREEGDLRKVLSVKEGRRFIWKLMANAGVFKSCFTGDSNSTFLNEGKQLIGLGLFSDVMTVSPESFVKMQRENVSMVAEKDNRINKIKQGELT